MMRYFLKRLKYEYYQIRNGDFNHLRRIIIKWFNHQETSLGFKLELNNHPPQPRSLKKIGIRVSKESDKSYFDSTNGLINQMQTCYVVTINDGVPALRLWLINASQNKKLKNIWGTLYPELNKDVVLLESAFTVPKYRGLGLHPAGMYHVAMKGKEIGANTAISFCRTTNINSLRSFNYAGFYPYTLRIEKWFLFRKTVQFKEIPDEILKNYYEVTDRKRKSKK